MGANLLAGNSPWKQLQIKEEKEREGRKGGERERMSEREREIENPRLLTIPVLFLLFMVHNRFTNQTHVSSTIKSLTDYY